MNNLNQLLKIKKIRKYIFSLAVIGIISFASLDTFGMEHIEGIRPVVQQGHTSTVTSVSIDPNGKYFISCSSDKTIKIWDFKSRSLIRTIGLDSYPKSIAIDPTGSFFVSSEIGIIKIWNLKKGNLIRTLDDWGPVAIDPAGKYVISGSWDKTIKVWEVNTGKLLRVLRGHSDEITSVAVNANGKYIVSGSKDSTVKVWDLNSGNFIRNFNSSSKKKSIDSVGIDPSGKYIVAGGRLNSLYVWNLNTGLLIQSHNYWVESLIIDPKGKYIITGSSDDNVAVWDLKKGDLVCTFKHSDNVTAVAVDSDGKYIVSGSQDKKIKVWDIQNRKELTIPNENSIHYSIANDKTGKYLVLGNKDTTIKVWDIEKGTLVRSILGHKDSVRKVIIDTSGNYIISGSKDTVKVWDFNTGSLVRTLKMFSKKADSVTSDPSFKYRPSKCLNSLMVDPGTKNIITGFNDGAIQVWDFKSGALIRTLKGHSRNVFAIAVDPSSKYIVSAGKDKTIKVWDFYSGDLIRTVEGLPVSLSLALTEDAIVSGGWTNSLHVSDLRTGSLIRAFNGHTATVGSVTIDPIGEYIVSGSRDNTVKVWGLKSGNLLRTLYGHSNEVESVAIDPTGKYIVSGSADGTLKRWQMNNGKLLATYYTFKDASLCITPEGYYTGTGNFQDYIHYVDNNHNIYKFDQFSRRFYRPETVELALSGQAVPAPESIESLIANKPAPQIEILSPTDQSKTDQDVVKITLSLTDNGGGIGDIFVYVNDSLIKAETRGLIIKGKTNPQNKVLRTYQVAMNEGENKIKAIAFNKDNSMSSNPVYVTINSDYKYGAPNIYVLATGIDEYGDPSLNLNYAVADAEYFVQAIQKQSKDLFNKVIVQSLTKPEETSKKAIENAFKALSEKMTAKDYFIYYASGHGDISKSNDGDSLFYLISSNVIFLDPDNLAKHAISQDDLIGFIGNIPARNKIIVMDTCHSGAAGQAIQIAMAGTNQKVAMRGMSNKTAMELIKLATGTSTFTASQGYEQAIEGYKGHGLFTYTLVEGIKGAADQDKDKMIKLTELKSYTEQTVISRSMTHFKIPQVPYINVNSLDVPIVKVD